MTSTPEAAADPKPQVVIIGAGPAGLTAAYELVTRYGITSERLARLRADSLVMHPGPTNRGVEIDALVADDPRSVINE